MEQVFECVLLTLFHFPPINIFKYLQIFSDICKYLQIFFTTRYFPPRSLWYPASFYFAVHKNYFRTSFETSVRMLDTHANVVAFWVVQPARQQLLTIKIFPESLTVRPLIEFFFWNKYFNDYIFLVLMLTDWSSELGKERIQEKYKLWVGFFMQGEKSAKTLKKVSSNPHITRYPDGWRRLQTSR